MSLHIRLSQVASRTKIRFLKKVGFYKPAVIHTSYIICATPRTGSTLLCEGMKNTSVAGHPWEYFTGPTELRLSERWGVSSYSDFFEKVLEYGTTPNGVFGAKIMVEHFDRFIDQIRKIPRYESSYTTSRFLPMVPPNLHFLPMVFPNLHYIWTTRRDKVRQAISLYKAVETGIWLSYKRRVSEKQIPFNFKRINSFYYLLLAKEIAWQRYFTELGITPFKVVYEDFVGNYEETIKEILNYLKIPIPNDLGIGKIKLLKQSDVLNEEWVERYHEIKRQDT